MPHDIRSAWFKTLGQLALILALAVVVGLLVGQIWPVVTVAALGVVAWHYWRLRKGLHEGAEELMVERSSSAEALGRAELWSNYRRIYARSQLREGNVAAAYALASRHVLADGSDYADLEWLSGWIALRFLKDPELALWHFERFGEAVGENVVT